MQVLHLIAKAARTTTSAAAAGGGNPPTIIRPVRSQSMEYELLRAPHRTFLNNAEVDGIIKTESGGGAAPPPRGGRRQQLIVYNLPSSLAEYLSTPCQEEAAYVRSLLYRGGGGGGGDGGGGDGGDNSHPLLVAYDPNADSFLGAEEADGGTGGDDADDLPPASRVLLLDGGNDAASRGATLVALSDLERSAASRLYGDPAGDAASRRRSPSGGGDVVVLVGSGGREHALAAALAASPLVGEVHCLPGNGGTMAEPGGKIRNAEGIIASTMVDNATVIEYVRGVNADMVVIGPEQPLVDGLVDALRAECPDVMAFGPTSAGARLEASKVRR